VRTRGPRPSAEVLLKIRAAGDEGAEILAHHLTDAMALPERLRQTFGNAGVELVGTYPRYVRSILDALRYVLPC
jgi:hypothetical protein